MQDLDVDTIFSTSRILADGTSCITQDAIQHSGTWHVQLKGEKARESHSFPNSLAIA